MPLSEIEKLIVEIRFSHKKWKDKYSVWDVAKILRNKYENTEFWDKPILGQDLPASKQGERVRSPKELVFNLEHMDFEIAAQQLIWILSLLENLVKEFHKEKGFGLETDYLSYERNFIPFLKKNSLILDSEEKEFVLSRRTRNLYVHDGGRVTQKWLDFFLEVRGIPSEYKLKTILPPRVDWIEEWEKIVMKIVERIENSF